MTTAADEGYYRGLSDDALVAAYLSYLDSYRRSHGGDRDFDRRRIVLIYGVAREQGRERLIDEAVDQRRQQTKRGAQ